MIASCETQPPQAPLTNGPDTRNKGMQFGGFAELGQDSGQAVLACTPQIRSKPSTAAQSWKRSANCPPEWHALYECGAGTICNDARMRNIQALE